MKIKKEYNKHAQFFLLAAVIISAIVISFGIIANQARINKEPEDLYEYSFSVKTETGEIIDFEIYSGVEGNLKDFVNKMADDLKDKDPDLNFIFLYGDYNELIIENYGDKEVTVSMIGIENETIEGAGFKIKSKIRYKVIEEEVNATARELNPGKEKKKYVELNSSNEINIIIEDTAYNFQVPKYKQVVFILYKEAEDERYISAD